MNKYAFKQGFVWVVSYCDENNTPVVTVFNNVDAANKCYKYFKAYDEYKNVQIDICKIHSQFLIGDEIKELNTESKNNEM